MRDLAKVSLNVEMQAKVTSRKTPVSNHRRDLTSNKFIYLDKVDNVACMRLYVHIRTKQTNTYKSI